MINLSTIITLYKTPLKKQKNLKVYKNYNLHIFEQEGNEIEKKKLSNNLKFKFKYFYSKKNIGLSKASNFLLKKVQTKYCLFTQADIKIEKKSILRLVSALNKNKNIILATPRLSKKKMISSKIKYVKNINAACILFDVRKIKKIGFFDEDYFLYWEDIQFIQKINESGHLMAVVNDAFAQHDGGKSTKNNYQINRIRSVNFIYGEFLYDYKQKKLRVLKLFRKFFQNLILFFFNIFIFQFKRSLMNLSVLEGIIKFITFYIKKIIL